MDYKSMWKELKDKLSQIENINIEKVLKLMSNIENKESIREPDKYYLIISKYINEPIGCCSYSELKSVHKEEPYVKFYEISEDEFNRYCDD